MMNVIKHANQYIQKASVASAIFSQFNQAQVDKIVEAVYKAAFNKRVELAKMAQEETGLGVWQHKVLKNVLATQLVYEDIKNQKTAGILFKDERTGITEYAQPYGPILAIAPVTNPTSTVLFKILICLKSRNPIIISPHRRAKNCCKEAMRICYEAALAADAPEDCIQIVEESSRDMTEALMRHPDLGLILATGGPGLVKAAYGSGNPAIGVGPGNVPVFIEESADIPFAVESVIKSKTFDNGTICASEQSIVVNKKIDEAVRKEFERQGCYFLDADEIKKMTPVVIDPERGGMAAQIVGQPASKLIELAGIDAPKDTKILLAPVSKVGKEEPLSEEILAPILSYYTCENFNEAVKTCIDLNHCGGLGHTASIYSNDNEKIDLFSELMDAGRIVVNTPSSQGGVGGIFNMLTPSLTLGCGAGGKNITSENITAKHLVNIKRCARRRDNEKLMRILPQNKYQDETLMEKDILALYDRNF